VRHLSEHHWRPDLPGSADCPIDVSHESLAIERDPDRAWDRAKRDAYLSKEIVEVWTQNGFVYGARRPAEKLIHHSDRGSQYVSIKYTVRLGDAGLEPSVGRVGDRYDNALAETIIGLFKTEVINRLGP